MSDVSNRKKIESYYHSVHRKTYEEILNDYKKKYIQNESKVEENLTKEEKLGISIVYDYIRAFNFDQDYFNIFTTSLVIHQKLYSQCPGKGFGGSLRETQAIMKGTNIDVMSAEEAKIYFNGFIATSDEIFLPLQEGDILKYIEQCVFTTTELIKAQPFADGNKRTFRSLMNLLLKRITLPPVYISPEVRRAYKNSLLKAMKTGDYRDLYEVYYYLINLSIEELALESIEYTSEHQKVKRLLEDIAKVE